VETPLDDARAGCAISAQADRATVSATNPAPAGGPLNSATGIHTGTSSSAAVSLANLHASNVALT
jgi:hypothetical protein